MTRPRRIQRRRTKGWRIPADAIYVGRPTRWGNPWRVGTLVERTSEGTTRRTPMTVEVAVSYYETDLRAGLLSFTADEARAALAGHDLACWCPLDRPCHADVLLQVANPEPPGEG